MEVFWLKNPSLIAYGVGGLILLHIVAFGYWVKKALEKPSSGWSDPKKLS